MTMRFVLALLAALLPSVALAQLTVRTAPANDNSANTAYVDVSLATRGLDIKTSGAVCDGASHPLSSLYSTLAAAQAVYPAATALSDEVDTVATQKALTAAGASTTKRVVANNGTCLFNRVAVLPAGITISGNATFKATTGNTTNPSILALADDTAAEGLTFTADGNGQVLVLAYNASRVKVLGATFRDTLRAGLGFSGSNTVEVTGTRFSNIGNGWKITNSGADRRQAMWICCTVGSATSFNYRITGNQFENIGLDPLSLGDTRNAVVEGNTCIQTAAQSQRLTVTDYATTADFPSCYYVNNSENIALSGNTAKDAPANGMDIVKTKGLAITGNTIEGSGTAGVAVAQSRGVTLSGNVVRNNVKQVLPGWLGNYPPQGAIGIRDNSSDITISGNVLTDDQATHTQTHGLWLDPAGTVTNVVISGPNVYAGNTAGPLNPTANSILQWSTWTPSYSSGTGSLSGSTTSTARYTQSGKLVQVNLIFTATYTTAGGAIIATLPTPAKSGGVLQGFQTTAGVAMACTTAAGSSTISCTRYDGNSPIQPGAFYLVSGTYEAQ